MAPRSSGTAPTSKEKKGLPRCARPGELRRANEVTRRTTALLRAAHRAETDFVIENPADRGDPLDPLFAEHGPIWLDGDMIDLAKACSTESATFAQCSFGASSQKYTTLWYTAGFAPSLRPMHGAVCTHAPGSHESAAGGVQHPNGKWNSSTSAAAYPADF
ncbi:MAG: hypothetical protein SGPRY_012968, partial [Prymnesium sp.]